MKATNLQEILRGIKNLTQRQMLCDILGCPPIQIWEATKNPILSKEETITNITQKMVLIPELITESVNIFLGPSSHRLTVEIPAKEKDFYTVTFFTHNQEQLRAVIIAQPGFRTGPKGYTCTIEQKTDSLDCFEQFIEEFRKKPFARAA